MYYKKVGGKMKQYCKKNVGLGIAFLTLLFIIGNVIATVATAVVVVTVPSDAGIAWEQGSTHDIVWTGENAKIYLIRPGHFDQTISSSYTTSPHSWTIPAGQTIADNYKIKVYAGFGNEDMSDNNFSIKAPNSAPNAPTSPQCDGKDSPATGIIDFTPEFSWTFSDPDATDTQGARQIIVGTSEDDFSMWNPCKDVSSSNSWTYVVGNALSRGVTYHWKVKTWDNSDVVGPYCTDQTFKINQLPNAPTAPKCEGETNPTQITTFTPTFSWTFSDDDATDTQGARQIIVGTTAGGTDMWNPGENTSSSNSWTYAGSDLTAGVTYHWKVKTWDNHDEVGPYCADQTFKIDESLASATLVPDEDITTGWDNSTGATHWDEINEALGSAGQDDDHIYTYLSSGSGSNSSFTDKFELTDPTDCIIQCTEITVKLRTKSYDADICNLEIKLFESDGTTQIGATWTISDITSSFAKKTNTWSGLDLSAADIDGLRIDVKKDGGTWYPTLYVSVINVDILYTGFTNEAPTAPTILWCERQVNPADVTDLTPGFSAIYNDANVYDFTNKYQIQVNTNATFTGDILWDSGTEASMPNVTAGNRCSEITYGGSALTRGSTYYWRIKFWDNCGGAESGWDASSPVANFTMKADVAGVYYVRTTGNDGNVGTDDTDAKAWKTVNEAATNMTVPGDIVYVAAGTYAETVAPQNPGTSGNLIKYIAVGTVTIDPSGGSDDGFLLANTANYIEINGFTITTASKGIHTNGCDDVVISNNDIHDNLYGIYGVGSDGLTISNNTIHAHTGSFAGIYKVGDGSTIHENTINSNHQGIDVGGDNVTISNNAIYSNDTEGIYEPGTGSTIKNNLIYSNDTKGIQIGSDNKTIEISNNTINSNGSDGIYALCTGSSAITIKNNIITNHSTAGDNGIWGNDDVTCTYNLLYNNTTHYYGCSDNGGGIVDDNPDFVSTSKKALDFHLQSSLVNGSCRGGDWGADPGNGNWTHAADANCSPGIDGGPDDPGTIEPEPNGDKINMGAFGNTAQASFNCFGITAVQLASFDARPEKNYILLNWITEAEIDNDKWLISRSETKDADYKQITKLHAEGVPNSYIYIDSSVTPGQAYWYKLGDVDKSGSITWHGPVLAKARQVIKFSFSLKEPAANPSTGKVKLEYSIPGYQGDKLRPVTLKIYNIGGQVVKTLVDERQEPGHYTIWWDGKNNKDKKIASGTYFCHFKANGELVRKLIRIK